MLSSTGLKKKLKRIETKDLLIGMLFVAFLSAAGMYVLATDDAAFYCEKYCEASFQDFVFYDKGRCACSTKNIEIAPFLENLIPIE